MCPVDGCVSGLTWPERDRLDSVARLGRLNQPSTTHAPHKLNLIEVDILKT